MAKKNLGRKPKEALADAGYRSEANLKALADRGIRPYAATGGPSTPMAKSAEPAGRSQRPCGENAGAPAF